MHVIPAIILAKSALDETIEALRRSELVNPTHCNRTLQEEISREEISFAIDLELTKKAIDCLCTSCASRHLTMLVTDPRTQLRYAVPSEYFDQRPLADLEFDSAFFRAMELSEQVVADPLYKLVCPYRGWVHGFVESEFRAWLGNPELGPLAGPHLRPFFHEIFRGETVLRLSPDVLTVEQEQPIKEGQIADGIATAPEAAEARMPRPGERRTRTGGKNPGDGAKNDDPYLIEMVHMIAKNEATSPNAAALQIAKANNEPAENAHRRLSTKFIEKYSSKRCDREPWGDVCRRIVDELQRK
jgi:hypothetical protein